MIGNRFPEILRGTYVKFQDKSPIRNRKLLIRKCIEYRNFLSIFFERRISVGEHEFSSYSNSLPDAFLLVKLYSMINL